MQSRDPRAGPKEKAKEYPVRGHLESVFLLFLRCPKAALQPISHAAQQLGLEKGMV